MSGEDFRDSASGQIQAVTAGADFKEVMAPVKTHNGIILGIDKQNRGRGVGVQDAAHGIEEKKIA